MNWEYLGKNVSPLGNTFPKTVETWRAKVPGGWLVMTIMSGEVTTHSTAFYPAPAYEWNGGTLQ